MLLVLWSSPTWTQGISEYPDPQDYYNKLINFGITHVFINDYVVEQWRLEKAWLNQPEFQKNYLELVLDSGGQLLFKIKNKV